MNSSEIPQQVLDSMFLLQLLVIKNGIVQNQDVRHVCLFFTMVAGRVMLAIAQQVRNMRTTKSPTFTAETFHFGWREVVNFHTSHCHIEKTVTLSSILGSCTSHLLNSTNILPQSNQVTQISVVTCDSL